NTVPGFVNQNSPEVLKAVEWLKLECGLDDSGAEQAIEYVVTGRTVLGAVPTFDTIIAERFFDEGGGMQLVVHAPFGPRINKAWGLSLRKRFCVSFNFELQAAATDNGINIALAEQHSFPLGDVFHFLHQNTVKEVLQQAALLSPLLETRWRWDANRSLALLRYWNGKKIPLQVQRTRSADLLASVFPDAAACQENVDGPIQVPDHPLLREVMKDIFYEAMDLDGLQEVLRKIHAGEIKCLAVDTPVPSVFSHEILNSNPYSFLDDAPLEERRARAVELRRALPESVLQEVGALDPAAIAEVRADAWPDVRDADELADVLQTLIALPEDFVPPDQRRAGDSWQPFFEQLRASQRATRARVSAHPEERVAPALLPVQSGAQAGAAVLQNGLGAQTPSPATWFWVSAEKAKAFRTIYPEAQFEQELPDVGGDVPQRDDALKAALTGWLTHLGPTTGSALAKLLSLPLAEIDKPLLRIESTGLILRGHFTGKPSTGEQAGSPASAGVALAGVEWSERRLLARIHRLTLGSLRKQIEPVTSATFMRWLLRWQHVAPGTQVRDERGTLEVLRQLQGFEIPASAWERQVLARRIGNYDPKLLDQLCLTGAVGWGRLSPHPATLEESAGNTRRVVPTSVAPITFFVRDDAEWMALPGVRSAHREAEREIKGLSAAGREV